MFRDLNVTKQKKVVPVVIPKAYNNPLCITEEKKSYVFVNLYTKSVTPILSRHEN